MMIVKYIKTTPINKEGIKMFLRFVFFMFTFPLTRAVNITAKPGCPTECGNVTVPYPFGIGVDCSLDDTFYLRCDTSNHDSPKLYIRESNLDVHNITDTELRISTIVSSQCYNQSGKVNGYTTHVGVPSQGAFTFSTKNKFTVVGCDDYALISDAYNKYFAGGCYGLCREKGDVANGECSGIGCCQSSIPKGLTYYNVTLNTLYSHSDVLSFNECGYGFLAEEGSFKFSVSDLSSSYSDVIRRIESTMPVVLDWVVLHDGTCTSKANKCQGNSSCYDVEGGRGYRCKCDAGYEGNPYLHPGCQDINECNNQGSYPCNGTCINTAGSYSCTCQLGYSGQANITNGCQPVAGNDSKFPLNIFIISMVFGLFSILCGIMGMLFGIRRRKLIKLREKFFEQNGGALLKQKIKSHGSNVIMTLFSTEQLKKATDNYSQENIVGKGGFGVVYKGVLPDLRVVAIKKSKLVDTTQAEQFINEVMILTQVIHRNVVKLLGCCLEEEVPVLVYEFISNDTLFHHIHHKLGGEDWLSWENRLRVATEAASALGYLHSETTMPIVHRDVKSTNILLDENYTTKISDFGASRLVPLDHEQVTTLVQGTLGYLDPEYFNSSQLTEKSDVYSFGVVLAELMTGNKAICAERTNKEKNLATYFINSVKENRLFEIVEPRILREGTLEQLQAVGDLVKRCLSSIGHDRPTMREVAVELESLRKFTAHPWAQQQTSGESKSLVLEIEQSDLYDIPLIGTNEWGSSSSITHMMLEQNYPR